MTIDDAGFVHEIAGGRTHGPYPARWIRSEADHPLTRDLHDVVVNLMFAASLDLHGALTLIDDRQVAGRIDHAIEGLDEAITAIRIACLELERRTALPCADAAGRHAIGATSTGVDRLERAALLVPLEQDPAGRSAAAVTLRP